jgi:regulator of protease activity HflC (stomatin/prohibitin superfamily)
VASVTLEALLGQRVSLGPQLVELITPRAETLGVKIHSAEVRDVMLPSDLRKAFGETLKARQEGLASLERARGESAALRNLANAARLLESQPALTTLRFLQTLEGKPQTLVMNHLPALFPNPAHGKETKPAAEPDAA